MLVVEAEIEYAGKLTLSMRRESRVSRCLSVAEVVHPGTRGITFLASGNPLWRVVHEQPARVARRDRPNLSPVTCEILQMLVDRLCGRPQLL